MQVHDFIVVPPAEIRAGPRSARDLKPLSAIITAFVLVLAAGVFRLTTYAPGPMGGFLGLTLTGACWSLAFSLYVIRYLPVMFGRRAGA